MANERRQLCILYRDFLFRMIDFELLSASERKSYSAIT